MSSPTSLPPPPPPAPLSSEPQQPSLPMLVPNGSVSPTSTTPTSAPASTKPSVTSQLFFHNSHVYILMSHICYIYVCIYVYREDKRAKWTPEEVSHMHIYSFSSTIPHSPLSSSSLYSSLSLSLSIG